MSKLDSQTIIIKHAARVVADIGAVLLSERCLIECWTRKRTSKVGQAVIGASGVLSVKIVSVGSSSSRVLICSRI